MRRAGAALLLPVCQCQAKRLVLAPRRTSCAPRPANEQTRGRGAAHDALYRTDRATGSRARGRWAAHDALYRTQHLTRARPSLDALMARRLNTLRLPAVIPEGSAYESSSDKENEPVPPDARRGQGRRRGAQAHGGGAAGVASREEADEVRARRARRRPGHGGPRARPSAGGEDVGETPRWSDDDAAGRALNEIDDNWRDDPVLNQARARRRTLGGTQRRRPRRIVPPVPIVSPPPSTERLLRARDRMVQARKRLHQCSPGRSLCEDLGCGCASNEAAPMVGLCARTRRSVPYNNTNLKFHLGARAQKRRSGSPRASPEMER